MWIIIVGLIINKIVTEIIVKIEYLYNLSNLNVPDHIWGWFFLDHIPELYVNSATKYFLINYNLRRLLTNCLIILKNIFNLSYLITITQYLLLLALYVYIHYLIILEFKYLKKKDNITFLNCFYILVHLIILNNIFFELCTYSLNFFLIPVLFISDALFNINFLVYYFLYMFILVKSIFGRYFFIKLNFIFFQIIINIYLLYTYIFYETLITNNFLNELCLKSLILFNFLLLKLLCFINNKCQL